MLWTEALSTPKHKQFLGWEYKLEYLKPQFQRELRKTKTD